MAPTPHLRYASPSTVTSFGLPWMSAAAFQRGSSGLCLPDDVSAIDFHSQHHVPAMYLRTDPTLLQSLPPPPPPQPQASSRYESQKRRDWTTFGQYLRNHRPPLALQRCSGAHVLEFLRYLDQFGKTKVHNGGCPFYGHPSPPASCPCPLRQAWGSLDALVGRLRAAYEENGGRPDTNPFGARAVRLYLREVRDSQAKARGIAYEKKRRKKPKPPLVSQLRPQAGNWP
ncbi:hypothetical protein MLD38_039254 [Melastoma candidum]|uniref:Uncharacterized protein n=1 Tax=Melastoma candidum TaxID=119954 RepID=A0ACB9L2Q5_9MYRT|nr:hypothetical protein MLD38_039254 [Melastoma candidum]